MPYTCSVTFDGARSMVLVTHYIKFSTNFYVHFSFMIAFLDKIVYRILFKIAFFGQNCIYNFFHDCFFGENFNYTFIRDCFLYLTLCKVLLIRVYTLAKSFDVFHINCVSLYEFFKL